MTAPGDHAPPLIAMVAPNGARRTRADHPALPLTPDTLARTAADCLAVGIPALHLHVRNRAGCHTLDPDAYGEALLAVRREVGDAMVIQVTTEAVGRYGAAEQMAVVKALEPEAASAAIRELVPDKAAEEPAKAFFAWARKARIALQYILYDTLDIHRLADLQRRGIVPEGSLSVIYVLGRYHPPQPAQPRDLLALLDIAPDHWRWMVCAFGPRECACALTAAALGGDVRFGFENNLHLACGQLAPDNAALARQLVTGAALLGRPLACASEVRRRWLGHGH